MTVPAPAPFAPMPAVTAEVDELPGFTELGVNGVAETQNWGGLETSGTGETGDRSVAAPPTAELRNRLLRCG